MKWKQWARKRINDGKQVQVACTYTNAGRWQYLTTSGRVCREEFGFVEDCEEHPETFDLPPMTWASVRRLQAALANG